MKWSATAPLCGIFVGGLSRRMAGYPKALLRTAEGETLVARTLRVVREAGLTPVLVGSGAHIARIVQNADVPVIGDAVSGVGPLGGLVALLEQAPHVAAVACDLPRLDASSLVLLCLTETEAPIVAARRDDRWEPLFARYEAARVLPLARERLARGALALQGLLDAAGTHAIDLPSSALDDVDTRIDAARAGLHEAEA